MDGGAQYNPRTVEEVFRDFKGRRAGLIKALTNGGLFWVFKNFHFCFVFAFWVTSIVVRKSRGKKRGGVLFNFADVLFSLSSSL